MVFRPDGTPFYVGKGTGDRANRHAARARANPHYAAVLAQAGGKLPVAIIARGLLEKEAFALEALFTEMIGIESEGGPLVNCGHGGRGGPIGVQRSDAWKANRRLKLIEAWQVETFRAKMLRADRDRSGNFHPRTDQFKAAVSEKLKGNTHTRGRRHTDESRAKMSMAHKGVPKSEQQRANMAEGARRGWVKRRQK